MSKIYLMITVADRNQSAKFQSFYADYHVGVSVSMLGRGTASQSALNYFGLEATEKSVLFSVVTGSTWVDIKGGLQKDMKIDIPGTGVAFVIPLASIARKGQLQLLLGQQAFEKGEESVLKDTKYELLVAIANQGYTDGIVDAARAAGSSGGTILHGKGSSASGSERFMGVSIASEKEAVLMVVRREERNAIIEAINAAAGQQTKAKSVIFTLPVTSTAGLRFAELSSEISSEELGEMENGPQRQ